MDLQLPSFNLFFTFLLLLFIAAKHWRKQYECQTAKLPPGPWKLPFIGNLHLFIGKLPHHCLRDLARKYGPLMHLQLGELSTVVVSSPEMAEKVMKKHDLLFATRHISLALKIITYDCTDIAFSPYGDYWRQVRKISIMEVLSAKRVQSFQSLREEVVSNFSQSIFASAGSPINLTTRLLSSTNDIICMAAFGQACKGKDTLLGLTKELFSLVGGFNLADTFPSLKLLAVVSGMKSRIERIHEKFDKILGIIIDDHRENRIATRTKTGESEEKDLVDVLLRVQEEGDLEFPLTTNNIKAIILDIFLAGSETSSNIIDWAMAEMMKNPMVMAKAQAELRQVLKGNRVVEEGDIQELSYLKSLIKETLRLHPPLPLLVARESSDRCNINGYEIPFKTRVIINAWAISRDPEHWCNAERFDPERFQCSSIDFRGSNFKYIPFGSGRRICPGISFGMANVKLQLAQLLYHFDWKLPNGISAEDLDMNESFGMTVRRRNDLHLIATPYVPSPDE